VGINATHRNEAGGAWADKFQYGQFEVQMGWQTCGSINEPWSSLDTFSAHWLRPVGERAQFNCWRWENHEYTALVEEMGRLPLDDPRTDDLFVAAMRIWMEALPVIPITQARKLLPFNPTFWEGWPNAENNYQHPCLWWQTTHQIIHRLKMSEASRATLAHETSGAAEQER
jgi:peptide/nickel transport system substrate-binding protein